MTIRNISVFLILLIASTANGQSAAEIANAASNMYDNQSAINTNFGYTKINDVSYVGFRFKPELAFGKLGFGLDVPVWFDVENFNVRTEEFKDGVGFLRIINYIRWGQKKKDPYYIRVGDLTGEYIGFGILLSNYTNNVSFEKRTIGLSFDVSLKDKYGLEGIYSDFDPNSFNLLAFRPYYRPFGATEIPLITTLEFGFGMVNDHGNSSLFSSDTTNYLSNGMTGISADVGMFLLTTSFIDLTLYSQYGRLLENEDLKNSLVINEQNDLMSYSGGDGISVGLAARMRVLWNVFELNARIERVWYKDHFLPQFFDAAYQIDKNAKIALLPGAEGNQGIYGALQADLIEKFRIGGGLFLPDNVDDNHPAMVMLNADVPDLIPKTIIEGRYFRGNITDLNDAFTLDENSQLSLLLAYKILPFFVAGVDYRWTFIPIGNKEYDVNHQWMPYVGLHFPLDLAK